MTKSIIFMFSGQGTQYFQMGRALYETLPKFRQTMDVLNGIYREVTNCSLIAELYGVKKPTELCDDLLISHPAIVMIEHALAQTLAEDGVVPVGTLGYSVGSFAAAVTAGLISAEQALTLAIRQAQAIQIHCQPGAMWALLTDSAIYAQSDLHHYAVIAAINFNGNFVIAAQEQHRIAIKQLLKENSISGQLLPVRFAFHSPWIDPAKEIFLKEMSNYLPPLVQVSALPLWCCALQAPLHRLPPDYFWTVVRRPVNLIQTVAQLEQRHGQLLYVDMGPSGSMATILKYLLPKSSPSVVMPVMSLFGDDVNNLASVRKAISSMD